MSSTKTILLVEDNEDDVFALKWAFRKIAIEIPMQVVVNGQQALDYLSGTSPYDDRELYPLPSLVFLDLKLPFVTGHEILRWIRRRPEFGDLSVIILSGSDETRDHEEAYANGANGYLVKPISREVLLRTLRAESAFSHLFAESRP